MIKKFLNAIQKRWGFDDFEKALLRLHKNNSTKQTKETTRIAIQTPSDYYILALYTQVIGVFRKNDECYVTGVWPNIFTLKQKRDILYPFRILYSILNSMLIKRKWTRLYTAIGVNSFYFLDRVSLFKKIYFLKKSLTVWKGLRTKEDLIALSIDDLYCGDLIYDTYLRYRIRPTVDLSSPYLLYYIYKCFCVKEAATRLAEETGISYYFSSYSTYIQHGVPVRIFLKRGVNVYTSGNFQQRFKKLQVTDHYHTAAHSKYLPLFKTLTNREEKVREGRKLLINKFSGVIDKATGYMKKSAYQPSNESHHIRLGVDGVVFLHDFYDSPHIYATMLFPDFYEWVDHTLKLIIDNSLNIGVKPHPNQVSDSKKDIDHIKKKYPSIQWIDPRISNSVIINSGIKFGISVYGTILHELAFHGINPICAGDNPHASFEFVHLPRSIEEYDQMILNSGNLRISPDCEDMVSAFYYMHNIHPKEDFHVNEKLFRGYNITNGSSALVLSAAIDR